MYTHLTEAIKRKEVILFVGAGVSSNLGLPTWDKLINKIADDLGYDSELFNILGNYNYPRLAEYYQLQKSSIGELRSWMDQTWHATIDIGSSEIHKLIVDLAFPIIYTTNYDNWLERTYDYYKKSYIKIVNVSDITKVKELTTQIIKFHGDFIDDNTLVLTESSYFKRLDFESPLDIKLRSDILGKSVLFIGYGLNDINIRYLIYKLNRMWNDSCFTCKPKSYILLTRSNPVEECILESWGIIPIVSDSNEPGDGLTVFLKNLIWPNINLSY